MRTWGAILGGTLAIVLLSLVTFDRVDATGLAFCAGGRSLDFSGQHVRLALSEAVTRRAVDHRANALPTGPSFPGLSLGAGTVSSRAARMANSRSSCVLMSGRGAAFESNFDGSAQIIPRMKRPEEIAELLRVCRTVLKGTSAFSEFDVSEEEIEVQQIRITGRYWLRFLDRKGLIDIGKDPARHPKATRAEFLELAKKHSAEIKLVSTEEAIEAARNFVESRQPHQIRKSMEYTQKLAKDYVGLFGASQFEDVMRRKAADLRFDEDMDKATENQHRRAAGSSLIVEAYIDMSNEAIQHLGSDNVLFGDWQTSGMKIYEFEGVRREALGKLIAAMDAEKAAGKAKAKADAAKGGVVAMADPSLLVHAEMKEGMHVEMQVVQNGPLGYVVKVEGKFDGLIYHDDLFDKQHPPKTGEVVEGWVLKVRTDGKVDVTLRPPGAKAKMDDGMTVVMKMLRKRKGRLNLGDKSKPAEIYSKLGISKKTFKEAIGHLFKLKIVTLTDNSVTLRPDSEWKGAKPKKTPSAASAESGAKNGNSDAKNGGKQLEIASVGGKSVVAANKGGSGIEIVSRAKDAAGDSNNAAAAAGGAEDDDDDVVVDDLKSREAVMARMMADEAEAKEMAKRRVNAKREKQAAMQRKRIEMERARLDPATVEKRKQLLESAVSSKGSGLRATMARRLKMKQQAQGNAGNAGNAEASGEASQQGDQIGKVQLHPEAPEGATLRRGRSGSATEISAESVAAIANTAGVPSRKLPSQ